MPPTTTTKSAPRKYGGKSKWDLRALGVSTKPSRKSKAGGTNAKFGAAKLADGKPGTTKVSNSTNANDETMNMSDETMRLDINNKAMNMNMSNEGGKVQDKEVMEMFRKFEEAQAAEAQAASDGFGSSGVSTVSESTTVIGIPESSNASSSFDSSNIFDDKPSFDFGISNSNIFGLRESPDIFDDKPSFNFATTSGGNLVLLNSQGTEVSVLATYAIPSKDRLPTFEGEVDFFRDWTQEELDEEQRASISAGDRQDTITNRQAARLRLRRKRFDFVGGPGYRVYLARRERRLTEDEDDFLPRKRMHTTQDLANMRAKWRVRKERPLRERALRRCLRMKCAVRERAVKYGKGGDADKARKGEDVDKGWKVLVERKVLADGGMADEGWQVDEVYAVGGDEQAMGDEDHPMGAEDQPMDIDRAEDGEDDDDDADTPRVPFRRESTPEPEGEEDWVM